MSSEILVFPVYEISVRLTVPFAIVSSPVPPTMLHSPFIWEVPCICSVDPLNLCCAQNDYVMCYCSNFSWQYISCGEKNNYLCYLQLTSLNFSHQYITYYFNTIIVVYKISITIYSMYTCILQYTHTILDGLVWSYTSSTYTSSGYIHHKSKDIHMGVTTHWE